MSIDNSNERFVQKLREKFATSDGKIDGVDAEPEWLESPTGITVTEHTGISELDEDTQNRLMAVMDNHRMANEKNKLFD